MAPEGTSEPTADEKRLAELGYKQDLERGWTRFTNFAISFSIISVLAGCFTTFYVAWNNGGPIAISIGWPVIALIILTVAVSMAELASAYPTAGGPYWWANSLGGPGWSWFTGWFNVLGLIGIVASVDYILSFFLTQLFSLWSLDLGFINFADTQHQISEIFWLFAVILVLHSLINIFSHRLLALFNSISVFWHVVGVLIIIGILVFVPDHHQSAKFVFTHKINNSGFNGGSVGGGTFWFLVLPVGFLLTM
jgi:amino acid transporter